MAMIIKRERIEITNNVKVSICHRDDGKFDVAVLTNMFPTVYPSEWEIDENEVQTREGISSMGVYGYIEHEVKPAYLEG